jgi:arylsulfatase A-like enzyme
VGLREPLVMNKKDSMVGMSPDQPTIALLLKDAGYETALIGKWHLGFLPEYSPNKNGFDYFYGIHSGAADYISHRGEKLGHDLYENEQPVYPKGYLTDLLKDKAVEFLEKKHDKPFFLSLQFNAPHWPWQGPGDKPYPDTMNLRAGGNQEIYAVMMKHLDDAVKTVLATLDKQNLASNTIVIFTSDNGGDKFSDMGPLRGGKPDLWEGGIKVPAFVRWPGKIKEGITEQPIITLDWTATILDLANAKFSPQFPPDGKSLVPFLTGERTSTPRTFYWRVTQRSKQKAMRDGNWKWIQDDKGEYLFDLAKDPGEKNDLKAIEPTIFNALKKKYEDWENTVLKPVPLGG